MRLAIVSDIHGNLEALEAVIADIGARAVDDVVCLGDFVGYGASPNECVERLRPRISGAVLGNHDAAAIGRLSLGDFNSDAATAARWTEQSLSADTRAYLEALPYTIERGAALLVHASPLEPGAWHYVLSPMDAAEEFEAFEQPICFIGHSHFPGTFERVGEDMRYSRLGEIATLEGRRYIVNVPSVGQPRDSDPRAGYALWDDARGIVQQIRLEYDVEAAMQRIRDAGLPPFLAERLRWGE
jgi:diadenosine tetraphosphatase ApaH/serine/threonine PP2A family protein phosphatase